MAVSPRASIVADFEKTPISWTGEPLEWISKCARSIRILEDRVMQLESQTTYAGHAGLSLSTPNTSPGLSITPTPTILTGYDTELTPYVDASANLANSSITITEPGLWIFLFGAGFDVASDSANQTREIAVEVYDTVGLSTSRVSSEAIARYQSLVKITSAVMLQVQAGGQTSELVMRIYSTSGHTIAVSTIHTLSYSVFRVSNQYSIPASGSGFSSGFSTGFGGGGFSA